LSGLLTEAAAEFCCRHLPKHVETAKHNFDNIRDRHADIKEEQRQQRHLIMSSQGKSEAQASQMLRGATRFLFRGLFPEKKLPDGSPSGKTHTGVEMVMKANPGMTQKQIFRKSVTSYATESMMHAMSLQRSAVTSRMSKQKEDYLTAHQKVGASGGINMMRLFGLDDDDPEDVTELAKLSFNKVAGIEHFGQQRLADAQDPFKAGSPAPSRIGGCRKTFPSAVAESPKIGEAGGEVSEPKRTSGGRVKRVVTLPASLLDSVSSAPKQNNVARTHGCLHERV